MRTRRLFPLLPSLRTAAFSLVASWALASPFAGKAMAEDAAASPAPAAASPASASPTSASPPEASAVIARVQGFYDQSSTFDADFTQEYWIKQYNQKKASSGHVTLKKPGKMYWRYNAPNGDRVVSDGKKVKIYEEGNKQMYEQELGASQYPAALSFLTGQGKLTDSFDLQVFDGEKMSFPGGWVMVGTPKTPTPAYQKVFFYVDKQTAQVRRVLILDGQGNHNRFDFDKPTLNAKVDDSKFVFSPPPGTSIIHP